MAFWRLGDSTFWDPDEAHYAQTTRELIETRDWLAPYYNERPFFDKPILFHWLQAVPMRALGQTELAARVVPALAAAVLVLVTWWFGARIGGTEVGTMAALLLAANPGVFALSRYAILDTTFTAFLFAGIALVAVSVLRDEPRIQYPGYVLIGLATFTKGPVALILCGAVFVIVVLFSVELRRRILALRWMPGLLIALAIPVPWFVYMLRRFNGTFVNGYILNENVLLFSTPLYANQPPWWFYFSIIGVGMLPWTPILLGRLLDHVAAVRRRGRIDVADVLLWSWVTAVVGFFSLSKFKLDHYVFPAAPALCVICARAWRDAHGAAPTAWRGTRIGVRLVGPALVVAGVAIGVVLVARLRLPMSALAIAVALIAAGVSAAVRYPRFTSAASLPIEALIALAAVYIGAIVWLLPSIEQRKVIPDVARWVKTHTTHQERIATFRLNRWNPAFRFYVGTHTLTLESDEDARQFFSDPSPYFCVMTMPLYRALRKAGVPLAIAYERDGLWMTSGAALWRQQSEQTAFVVTVPVYNRGSP